MSRPCHRGCRAAMSRSAGRLGLSLRTRSRPTRTAIPRQSSGRPLPRSPPPRARREPNRQRSRSWGSPPLRAIETNREGTVRSWCGISAARTRPTSPRPMSPRRRLDLRSGERFPRNGQRLPSHRHRWHPHHRRAFPRGADGSRPPPAPGPRPSHWSPSRPGTRPQLESALGFPPPAARRRRMPLRSSLCPSHGAAPRRGFSSPAAPDLRRKRWSR
jgi:hypothetical protein